MKIYLATDIITGTMDGSLTRMKQRKRLLSFFYLEKEEKTTVLRYIKTGISRLKEQK